MYEDYVEMATEEERMCWQFSIELCRMISRPFSQQVLEISDRYWDCVQNMLLLQNTDQSAGFIEILTQIGQDERQNFGYSAILGDKFYWDNDEPKLM